MLKGGATQGLLRGNECVKPSRVRESDRGGRGVRERWAVSRDQPGDSTQVLLNHHMLTGRTCGMGGA